MLITRNTMITADSHFGHLNIRKHVPMRCEALGDDQDLALAEKWNSVVCDETDIFHLGDFSFKCDDIESVIDRLNGRKYLLRGNHDRSPKTHLAAGFLEVIDFPEKGLPAYLVAEVDGIKILFSHYPIVSDGYDHTQWKYLAEIFERENCDVNIHGHTHDMEIDSDKCICACVEKTDFKPIKLGDLLHIFLNRR